MIRMRKIAEAIFSLFWTTNDDNQSLRIVKDYHHHDKQIDQLLQSMPEVLQAVHHDLTQLSQSHKREREADFTTDSLLHALMGFRPKDDSLEDLAEEVEFLSVPKRLGDFGDVMMRMYQHFRAGMEGTISCLLPWQIKCPSFP